MLFEFWWKICHDVGLQCSSFCRLAAECVPTSFSWFTLINHPDSKGRRNVVKQCEIKLWCMFSICRIVTEGEKSAAVVFPRHSMARLGSARLCWTRCTFGTRYFFQSELSRAKLYPAVETQRTGPREYCFKKHPIREVQCVAGWRLLMCSGSWINSAAFGLVQFCRLIV